MLTSFDYIQNIDPLTKSISFNVLLRNIDTNKSFIRFYFNMYDTTMYKNIFSTNKMGYNIIQNCFVETDNKEIDDIVTDNNDEKLNYTNCMKNTLSSFYAAFDTKVIMKNSTFNFYNHSIRKKILSCKIPLSILTGIKSNNFSFSKITILFNDNYINLTKSRCKLTLCKCNIKYKRIRFTICVNHLKNKILRY